MLLNFSNHPSTKWGSEQLLAATQQYMGVKDLPFPDIDPMSDEVEIEKLAAEYAERILDSNKSGLAAIHIMGEMTFVYHFVRLMEVRGVRCIASSTKREVEMIDGVKNSRFTFVRFRGYSPNRS